MENDEQLLRAAEDVQTDKDKDGSSEEENYSIRMEVSEENIPDEEQRALVGKLKEILNREDKGMIHNLKYIDGAQLRRETTKVNAILEYIKIKDLTEMRNLAQAAAILVGELIGINKKKAKPRKEPFWKRRINDDIQKLRKDISRIEEWFKGRWKNSKIKEKEDLDRRYKLKAKGFNTVIEELKQRVVAKSSKVKRYANRIRQFQENRNFQTDQGKFFKNLKNLKFKKSKRYGQRHSTT